MTEQLQLRIEDGDELWPLWEGELSFAGRHLGRGLEESRLWEAERLSLRDEVLTHCAPVGAARDWIDKKYGIAIADAFRQAPGREARFPTASPPGGVTAHRSSDRHSRAEISPRANRSFPVDLSKLEPVITSIITCWLPYDTGDDMDFRFIHAADLHLGAAFQGIEADAPSIAATLREATFEAYSRVIDAAVERGVAFVVFAGDVYNRADRNLRSELRFRDGLRRLESAGIPAFVVHGNHDHIGGWSAGLDWPDNVHIFPAVPSSPQVIEHGGRAVASVTGISYETTAVTEDLTQKYHRHHRDLFAVAVLHASVGDQPGHAAYAPCTLADLRRSDFDYWALGHIHVAAVLSQTRPVVAYSGSTQGLNPKELGRRSCFMVSVQNGEAMPTPIETDSIRWFHETVDINSLGREQDLLNTLESRLEAIGLSIGSRNALVRFRLVGRGPLYKVVSRPRLLQDLAGQLRDGNDGERFIWTESIRNETSAPIDWQAWRESPEFVGDFLRATGELSAPDSIGSVQEALNEMFDSRARRWLDPLTETQIRRWLDRAEQVGVERLLETEG
jgi:DNA repair exonuclease SbcCD nuclease subunit